MKEREKEIHHYTESVFYTMEQAVVYLGVKGAQLFNKLDVGITIDQFTTLDTLYINNNICQRDLSKLILKDRSNTGRILNILELKGFVERKAETKGKRLVKNVCITQKGRKMVETMQPKLKEAFLHAFEDITDEEFSYIRKFLNKLNDRLSKITSIQI